MKPIKALHTYCVEIIDKREKVPFACEEWPFV